MKTDEFLSLGEVAANFGWTTRFVERLAATGKLPGVEVGGQWRFRREDLIDWLDQKIQTLDTDRVEELEHKLEADLHAEVRRIHIASRLNTNVIALDAPAPGKVEVLKELVALAEKSGHVLDGSLLHASLLEREALASTALPGGLAICHPRRPAPHLLRQTVLAILRTREPVAFGALDGEPTRLFFLIAAIDDQAHLYALARLTRILRQPAIEALHRVGDAAEMISLIRDREGEIDGSTGSRSASP